MQRLNIFKSRFFWKIYLVYALLIATTSAIVAGVVHYQVKHASLVDVEATLKDKATFVEPFVKQALSDPNAVPTVRHLVVDTVHDGSTRITIIRPDGQVLIDSEGHAEKDENQQPEIVAALHQPFGFSHRYSGTDEHAMYYVAKAVRNTEGTLLGFIRVSLPLSTVEAKLASLGAKVAVGTLIGMLFALLAGLFVARRVTVPIAEMMDVAEAIRNGRYDSRVHTLPHDEIGVLGATLNQVADEMIKRVATISQDRAQLRAMFAGMVEGILAVDDEDRLLFCNAAARRLLGLKARPKAGEKLHGFVTLTDLHALVSLAREKREAVKSEVTLERTTKTGSQEMIITTHATSFDGGETRGVMIVLHDITDLRRLERVRRDFVANVSHELKTPLTSIRGYVETLIGGAVNEPKINVRFLSKIEDNVVRLNNLVQDLLHLARIEAHDDPWQLEPVDWRRVLDGVLSRHEDALKRKELSFQLESTPGAIKVLGDSEAMTQVVDNLVDNAIKYTPGPGKITIRLIRDGARGVLEVEDTGIGIPEHDLDRVFERFYRVDKARSREVGGTGLGLSIVKHLVSSMEGEVRVRSQVGHGTCFAVHLPLAN